MRTNRGKDVFAVLIVIVLAGAPAYAGSDGKPILPPPTQVSPHVYAWLGPHEGPSQANQGYRMNLAFVVGDKAVAVLETGYTEAMAREMLAHIAKITKLPVKYAINSNSQPDRFFGNEVFRKQGATVIAHEKEAARMAQNGGDLAGAIERTLGLAEGSVTPPGPPDKMINADMSLDLGGVVLHVRHFGAAHTPAPLVVHVPADDVVYAGDILYAGRLLAVVPGGNAKAWIQTFDALKTFGDATFIPGHGKPAKLGAFTFPTRDYLVLLNDYMAQKVEEGVGMDDAIKGLDQSRFAKLANFEELAGRNASWVYLEREAESFK